MSKPKIRFKGCQGEWERKKLGDIARKVSEKNTQCEYKETFTNSSEMGIISQLDYFDHDITNKANISGYYVVQSDDFVYNPRISVTAPVGPISRNKLGRCGIMSPLYTVFHFEKVDNGFMEYYFKTIVWHSFMYQEGNTGARNDRFSIKDSVFFTMPILLPPTLPEQRQIAAYFRSLDGILSGCEARLSSLRRLKEGALQAFFPQQGETQPKIRFKGCNGEWERKKLGEVCEYVRGVTYNKAQETNSEDKPCWKILRANNIDVHDSTLFLEDVKLISADVRIRPNQWLKKGDILICAGSGSKDHIGKVAYIFDDMDYSFGGFMAVIRITAPIDSHFLFNLLNGETFHDYLGCTLSSTTINNLNAGIMNLFEITLPPSLPEQHLIANFFRTLDRRIELERQRLEKLKQLKAACLEKMFV